MVRTPATGVTVVGGQIAARVLSLVERGSHGKTLGKAGEDP